MHSVRKNSVGVVQPEKRKLHGDFFAAPKGGRGPTKEPKWDFL